MMAERKLQNYKKKSLYITLIVIAILLLSAVCVMYCNRLFCPPSFVTWQEKCDEDLRTNLQLKLENKRLCAIGEEDNIVWTTPVGFKVSDYILCDIDRDSNDELVMLCWKRGKYGNSRPSWVKRDEIRWSQHIAIYDLEHDKISPEWMASDIGFDVKGWTYKDKKLALGDSDGNISYWTWDGWGLYRVTDMED